MNVIANLTTAYTDLQMQDYYVTLANIIAVKYPQINFIGYCENVKKERTKAFRVKGGYSARQSPFAVLTDLDNNPIKAFYSEADECTIENIVQYLDTFIEQQKQNVMQVQVVATTTNQLPSYETPESAGCDLRAELSLVKTKFLFDAEILTSDEVITEIIINPGGRALIPTGIQIALPVGYEAQVRARSGLALKQGITVLNSPGTIDSDYRGDIGVIVINHGFEPFSIKQGDRIAQLVIAKHEKVEFVPVPELNDTDRGGGGFGSTGCN